MSSPEEMPGTVTRLLHKWRGGDAAALEALIPLVYAELRRVARAQLRGQARVLTLQPTALVHEAYARMIDLELDWQDRTHFLSMAARTMRRVLIDHARARNAVKRGAGAVQVSLHPDHARTEISIDLLALDRALNGLAQQDERAASVLELFYFGGFTAREIGEALTISRATAERDLRFAKTWLRRQLGAGSLEES